MRGRMPPADADLPPTARPFLGFARLLRGAAFPVAPEQVVSFMRAATLLGPRSIGDIREAALATLAPPPDRRDAFEACFRSYFYGEGGAVGGGDSEEETRVRDDSGAHEERAQVLREAKGGALSSRAEQLSARAFEPAGDGLSRFQHALASALPVRRSFRTTPTASRGTPDLRRSLRTIVQSDGDLPRLLLRRRQVVTRGLVLLIDISGSMKRHTGDYLQVAHAAVQGAGRVEVFTFGTRLSRITPALRVHDRDQALARAAASVDDWDGGTRIGPALLAFLSVPRFGAFARGASVAILSDGLERGDHAAMAAAIRRLGARAFRLSLCTPLAGDPRFRPATAALRAILPLLDDLVDGSSVAALTTFLLSLGRPAPAAASVWRGAP